MDPTHHYLLHDELEELKSVSSGGKDVVCIHIACCSSTYMAVAVTMTLSEDMWSGPTPFSAIILEEGRIKMFKHVACVTRFSWKVDYFRTFIKPKIFYIQCKK